MKKNKSERWTKKKLEELFDEQIERLRNRGLPERIVELLAVQRGEVIKTALQMARRGKFSEGVIPFLPVIPRNILSLDLQMVLVWHKGRSGVLDPGLREERNPETMPEMSPYYFFGQFIFHPKEKVSRQELENYAKKFGGRASIIEEVCACATHTDVLSYHNCLTADYYHDGALCIRLMWHKFSAHAPAVIRPVLTDIID